MSVISWTGSVLHRLTGRGGAVAVVALGIAFGMTQGAFAATVGHEHEDGVDWVNGAGSAETGPEGAYVTIDEAGLDAIYAQAGVDVRVMSTQTLVNPDYLDIDTTAKSFGLLNTAGPGPVIDMYYVDTVSACGTTTGAPGIVGCGWVGAPGLYIESSFADSGFGNELIAHEIGHNLGLGHTADGSGLMGAFLNGETTLSAAEIAITLASNLIQTDSSDGSLYIEIAPWLVTDRINVVPLPASGVMLLVGAGALASLRRRRKAA